MNIEGDKVKDESGREVARVTSQNKLVLGREEHDLRLVIIQPVTKPIKDPEEKIVAEEMVKSARVQVEFLDPHNDVPIFKQVISEEICKEKQRGVKRKNNSQLGEKAETSDSPTNLAELQSPTANSSCQDVPVEPATPVLRKSVIKLTQSEVEEHAIPAGKKFLFWLLFCCLLYAFLFLCRHQDLHFFWSVRK